MSKFIKIGFLGFDKVREIISDDDASPIYHLSNLLMPIRYGFKVNSRNDLNSHTVVYVDCENLRDGIKRLRAWGKYPRQTYYLSTFGRPVEY